MFALSRAATARLGAHEALGFDRDYAAFRFGRRRRQAFTVYS